MLDVNSINDIQRQSKMGNLLEPRDDVRMSVLVVLPGDRERWKTNASRTKATKIFNTICKGKPVKMLKQWSFSNNYTSSGTNTKSNVKSNCSCQEALIHFHDNCTSSLTTSIPSHIISQGSDWYLWMAPCATIRNQKSRP